MQNEKMRRFDLYVGCNVNGKSRYTRTEVQTIVKQALTELCLDGCTFTDATGVWEGESEQTVICTVCTDCIRERILVLAGLIKDYLHQQSVMIVESEPTITFIS
jgi:hypothetical protein